MTDFGLLHSCEYHHAKEEEISTALALFVVYCYVMTGNSYGYLDC